MRAAIQSTYHRTPTRLRNLARHMSPGNPNEYAFRLNFRPPYAWKTMLDFLALRATPGVEAVDADTYRRTIALEGREGWFTVSPHEKDKDALLLRLQFGEPKLLFTIVERIRAMFDLNADWATIVEKLRRSPQLAESVRRYPGLRVPGCWDGFELTVRAILGQQVSVRAATTFAGRIAHAFGRRISGAGQLTHLFPTPQILASEELSTVGLTTSRAATIRRLARAVADGEIKFEAVVDVNAFVEQLCSVPGIGPWTAQYVAMRALGEPDAFPSGDVALAAACGVNMRTLEDQAQAWRPWRAYAAMYLWNSKGNTPAPYETRASGQ
jgi:AraC family transcriptional regulator of adaptative response / DNA-3-methyladenine glycosylase II